LILNIHLQTALHHEKETFQTYNKLLGDEHEKTRESSECLRQLTHQAVTFQKRMNEASRSAVSISHLLPIQVPRSDLPQLPRPLR
jgi:protein TIF31